MQWKRILKWTGITIGGLVVLLVLFLGFKLSGFGREVARVYDIPVPALAATTDSAAVARGQHLAESIGGCIACHGDGLGGKLVEEMGPIGTIHAPNLTTGAGGIGSHYTDGELARAVAHGVKQDGRTVLFMPSQEFSWWPDDDLVAIVSYVRSLPPIDNEEPASTIRFLGKMLDQFDQIPLTIARRIDHEASHEDVPDPEPTAAYGRYISLGCVGCHGDGFSGGRIPGAPAEFPVPTNLTQHETGLAGWSQEDFATALRTGTRPDGTQLDPFMPVQMTRNMNDLEISAIWAYLQTLEPQELGNR